VIEEPVGKDFELVVTQDSVVEAIEHGSSQPASVLSCRKRVVEAWQLVTFLSDASRYKEVTPQNYGENPDKHPVVM